LLVVLIAGLATVDPLVCPDGCTDAAPQAFSSSSSLSHTSNPCLLCHNAVGWTPWPSLSLSTTLVSATPDTGDGSLILPLLNRIEHPPRSL
jgi:hypothetical protein